MRDEGVGICGTFERVMGMLSFRLLGIEFRISIFAILAVFFILMADFSEYTFLILLAAVLHEAGHICAMRILGESLKRVSIYPFGADMNVCAMLGYREDFLISFSGPVVNLILFFAFIFAHDTHLKFFAVANLALAVVNLIPAPGLDGGRMLDSVIYAHYDFECAEKLTKLVGFLGFVLLSVFTVLVLFLSGGNFSVAFILVYLVLGVVGRGK